MAGPKSENSAWLDYPMLFQLLDLIGGDNDIPLRDEPNWPTNSAALEAEACRLDEAEAIIAKHGVQALDKFLNAAFDGDQSENFYDLG